MLVPLATVALFVVVAAVTLAVARALTGGRPPPVEPAPFQRDDIPVTVADEEDEPVGSRPIDPRFFPAALLSVLSVGALALLFPVALVFRRWVVAGHARHAAAVLLFFVALLAGGLGYAWKRGDLDRLLPPS